MIAAGRVDPANGGVDAVEAEDAPCQGRLVKSCGPSGSQDLAFKESQACFIAKRSEWPSRFACAPKTCPQLWRLPSAPQKSIDVQRLSELPAAAGIPTTSLSGRYSSVSTSATKNRPFAGGSASEKSPLTDSNRRPPPYHGGFAPLLCDLETGLATRFPCNPAGFSACSTVSLKDPEPPRKAPNLSPEPRPNASPCSLTTRPSCIAAWCRIRELAAATAKASSIPLSARFRLTPSGVRHCDPVRWLA
jgi:hypothetical protein